MGTIQISINKEQRQQFYIQENIETFASSDKREPGLGEYDKNEPELN